MKLSDVLEAMRRVLDGDTPTLVDPIELAEWVAAREEQQARVAEVKLYWHCECGINEPAQQEYEHGDSEPCCFCDGVARVVTLKEAAQWEQAKALGNVWRPKD